MHHQVVMTYTTSVHRIILHFLIFLPAVPSAMVPGMATPCAFRNSAITWPPPLLLLRACKASRSAHRHALVKMESSKGDADVVSSLDEGFVTQDQSTSGPRRINTTPARGPRADPRRSASRASQKGRRWEIKLREQNSKELAGAKTSNTGQIVAVTQDNEFEKTGVGKVTEDTDLQQLSETESEYLDLLADMMLEKDIENLEGAASVARDLRCECIRRAGDNYTRICAHTHTLTYM
jgi:hypothetical protein